VGPAPKCRSSAFTEALEKSFRCTSRKDLSGYRNPKGGVTEAEERVAAGRRYCPEAVTEQKAGYKTRDALWTKVLIRVPATDVHCYRCIHRVSKASDGKSEPVTYAPTAKVPAIVIQAEREHLNQRVPGAKAIRSDPRRENATVCRYGFP
jgi:hypothetical protein